MRRNDPDVMEVGAGSALPAPATDIVRWLSPLVTPQRQSRIDDVIAKRHRAVVPVLDDLADPHNGAAVLRSADAFGCAAVHIIESRHSFAIGKRVSRRTDRWLDMVKYPSAADCAATLRRAGYQIYVASMQAARKVEDLREFERVAVVFGNEHAGPSAQMQALAQGTFSIPMCGFVESLNVSVASAITLYTLSRGRQGELNEEERLELRAHYLLAAVGDADRIIREKLEKRA